MNIFSKINNDFKNLNQVDKKNILLVAFNMFALLFSYPMIRSASTAIFVDFYGAKNTPWVWILSVVALALSVGVLNKFQKKSSIYVLYKGVILITSLTFLVCNIAYASGYEFVAFPYYIWKEVYIILLVHLSLGYLNSKVDFKVAKLTYGPLGALGSLGGVLGGMVTTNIVPSVGLIWTGTFGAIIVLCTLALFKNTHQDFLGVKKDKTPLEEAKKVKGHILMMCLIVMISQFVINLANFKFNLGLEKNFLGAINKGEFLGKIYSYINLVSFSFQVLFIPIILKIFKVKWVHFTIPFIFGVLFLTTFSGLGFLPVTILFVSYKGLDYSLFSTAKEMLYFPLNKAQKYGAKYIVDMIVYRASKMLISSVLLIFNSAFFVDSLLGICLIIWILLTIVFLRSKNLSQPS